MKTFHTHVCLFALLLAALALAACSTAAQKSYTDPFAYCAAVGNIDAPGANYTGPAVPDEVINAYKQAAGLQDSSMPLEQFQKSTSWRCMDKQVYACNVGANLPCQEKASTEKTPTQEMKDFCAANPGADVIPAVVTGRATIYNWKCNQSTPEAGEAFDQPDARGFLSSIWYKLEK